MMTEQVALRTEADEAIVHNPSYEKTYHLFTKNFPPEKFSDVLFYSIEAFVRSQFESMGVESIEELISKYLKRNDIDPNSKKALDLKSIEIFVRGSIKKSKGLDLGNNRISQESETRHIFGERPLYTLPIKYGGHVTKIKSYLAQFESFLDDEISDRGNHLSLGNLAGDFDPEFKLILKSDPAYSMTSTISLIKGGGSRQRDYSPAIRIKSSNSMGPLSHPEKTTTDLGRVVEQHYGPGFTEVITDIHYEKIHRSD